MLPVGVSCDITAPRRSVATALYLAGIRALARVRAGVRNELATLRRSVASVCVCVCVCDTLLFVVFKEFVCLCVYIT